jgi:hypothetical protein
LLSYYSIAFSHALNSDTDKQENNWEYHS